MIRIAAPLLNIISAYCPTVAPACRVTMTRVVTSLNYWRRFFPGTGLHGARRAPRLRLRVRRADRGWQLQRKLLEDSKGRWGSALRASKAHQVGRRPFAIAVEVETRIAREYADNARECEVRGELGRGVTAIWIKRDSRWGHLAYGGRLSI